MGSLYRGHMAAGLAAGLSAAILASGCTSYRVASTAPAKQGPPPVGVKFNIEAVHYSAPTNVAGGGLSPFGVYQLSDEELRTRLMRVAEDTYPQVFADEAGAIPLQVAVTRSAFRSSMGGDACVSCLTLMILPLRSVDETDYSVQVRGRDEAVNPTLSRAIVFTRIDTGWMSVWPTGWIPVPGGTGRRAWGMDSAMAKGGNLTLKSCVEGVISALRRVDPNAWKAAQQPADK
jgi:hypothetical protein